MSIQAQISESARIAIEVAWPALQPLVRGRLLADEAHAMLDQDAGIDLVWERERGSRIPCSVRFQRGHDWRSFTLRESEIRKFSRAIADGMSLRPIYMIHTYLDYRGALLSTAMCRIDRLIDLLPDYSAWRHNPVDGTPFKAVFWDDFRGIGIKVAVP